MCLVTVPIAALAVLAQWERVASAGIFHGFDSLVITLVVLNAIGGLVVALVLKFGDNVLKNFSCACSVVIGTIISATLFDFVSAAQSAGASKTKPPQSTVGSKILSQNKNLTSRNQKTHL